MNTQWTGYVNSPNHPPFVPITPSAWTNVPLPAGHPDPRFHMAPSHTGMAATMTQNYAHANMREHWKHIRKDAEQKLKEAEEQERREEAAAEEEKKQQAAQLAALNAFWGGSITRHATGKTNSSPKIVNVNIENLKHGVFGQSGPEPPATVHLHEPPKMVAPAPAFAYTTYPVHPMVNYATRPAYPIPAPNTPEPPKRDLADPWAAGFKPGDPGKEVVDVAQLIATQRSPEIQINPVVSAYLKSPQLRVDLRDPLEHIRSVHKKSDTEFELREWKGHDQPLTLPILNSVVLVSPLLPQPMVVSNPTGVTVGDFLAHIISWAQTPLSADAVSAVTRSQQEYMEKIGFCLRQPIHPSSVIGPHSSSIDLLFGRVILRGLKREESATRDILGWNHPACFLVDFTKDERITATLRAMSGGGAPAPMVMGMPTGMAMPAYTSYGVPMMPAMQYAYPGWA